MIVTPKTYRAVGSYDSRQCDAEIELILLLSDGETYDLSSISTGYGPSYDARLHECIKAGIQKGLQIDKDHNSGFHVSVSILRPQRDWWVPVVFEKAACLAAREIRSQMLEQAESELASKRSASKP
jgi:hypothetical protein